MKQKESGKPLLNLRWRLFIIIIFLTIIPLLFVVYFSSNRMFGYLEQQTREYYSSLIKQVIINLNYIQNQYHKTLEEISQMDNFQKVINAPRFNTAIEELTYDTKIGERGGMPRGGTIRRKASTKIDGDIAIIQLDRKSLITKTDYKVTYHSGGNIIINVDKLVIDPLFVDLQDREGDFAFGLFQNDVLVGFEAEERPVMIYPYYEGGRRNFTKFILVILNKNFIYDLYRHIHNLRSGTLIIADKYDNIISMNHPGSDDFFTWDIDENRFIQNGQSGIDQDASLSLDDYNQLIMNRNILREPEVLDFLGNEYQKNIQVKRIIQGEQVRLLKYENSTYLTIADFEKQTGFKLVFFLPLKRIYEPVVKVIRVIVLVTALVIFLLIVSTVGFSFMIARPVEVRQQTMAQRNLYFMNLAHETKTPLTLIKNYLQRFVTTHEMTDELQIIQQNINKLERDMVNFLDAGKIERGQFFYDHNRVTALSQLVGRKEELYREITTRNNLSIDFFIEADLYTRADPLAVERIINNLLDNAVKYTGEGGSITVHLKNVKDRIEFSVTDTGVGIDENQIRKIFQPFSQMSIDKRSSPGVGLGLYIVSQVIKSMKATINVTSRPGEGSTFYVRFKPYQRQMSDIVNEDLYDNNKPIQYSNIITEINESDQVPGRPHILLVEDNRDLLNYLKINMEEQHNIHFAFNGLEALKKLEVIPKPDLIISDVLMDKMTGYELYEEMSKKDEYQDIPFIFLTAIASQDEKIKALTSGAVDFINKPFAIEELMARVNSLLNYQDIKHQLYEQDKYATLGMLLGGISHEIFNPLLGIYAPLENLEAIVTDENRENDPEKTARYFKNIFDNIKRIENIIKSLKVLYYERDMDSETLDLEQIINSIIEIFQGKLKDRIELTCTIAPGFTIEGNHSAVSQVLLNLVSNAIDAIEDEGSIEITAGQKGRQKFISVKDSGSGISKEDQNQIFNAFYTTKEVGKGTGLGLYLVKDLLLKMNWNIELISELHKGTEFIITM
jgi:signal transduction histidine kinase